MSTPRAESGRAESYGWRARVQSGGRRAREKKGQTVIGVSYLRARRALSSFSVKDEGWDPR